MGVYKNGDVFEFDDSDLSCNSSSSEVVKVSNCQELILDDETTKSDSEAIVTVETASGLTSKISLRMWYPTTPDIIVDIEELHKITNAKGLDCSNIYEEAVVDVQVEFSSGSETETAFVTSYVSNTISSSDTSVLEIVIDGDTVRARGIKGGTAQITLTGSNAVPVAIEVSDIAVQVEDISFNLHTSLDPVDLVLPSTGPPYTSTASVIITKDLNRINTRAIVVADAVLSQWKEL